MSPPRSRAVRLARTALWVYAVGQVGQAAVLRMRRAQVPDLPPVPGLRGPNAESGLGDADEGAAAASAAPGPGSLGALPKRSNFRSVTAVDVLAPADVEIDEVTLAEVADLMERSGVDVVDLVPGDLSTEVALRWLRRVDPTRASGDVLYSPGGAHEALALQPDVSRRMAGVVPAGLRGPNAEPGSDRGTFVRQTVTAQRYAPGRHTVRFVPRLRASARTPADHWRELQEIHAGTRPYGELAPVIVGLQTARLAVLTLAPLVSPVAGVAALAAWSAQPLLVFSGHPGEAGGSGTAVEPPDLAPASALRLVRGWIEAVALIRAYGEVRPPRPTAAPEPTEALFEDRIDTCPWCGAGSLVGRLDIDDVFQHKPGMFHLDECTSCGHIFQNPRLSLAGLDHYYDEFYDGYGGEQWEKTFAGMGKSYDGRVEAVAAQTEPQAWLDVGTGHGHFCLVARQRWPKARFDGLDLSESVIEAERRGWIDRAHHGLFPELADGLAGEYDVVSMHHYLEHTREPREELAAAARVLPPGGHLLIEGPDSASPWARLGRYWRCWFQPQHQHFVTCENLLAELDRLGFEVLSLQRAEASEGKNLVFAVNFMTTRVAGRPREPWRADLTPAQRVRRPVVMGLSIPFLAGALLVDLVKDSIDIRPGNTGPGNAYRVVARRR
jgi:SAM-dependent methyltransferase